MVGVHFLKWTIFLNTKAENKSMVNDLFGEFEPRTIKLRISEPLNGPQVVCSGSSLKSPSIPMGNKISGVFLRS